MKIIKFVIVPILSVLLSTAAIGKVNVEDNATKVIEQPEIDKLINLSQLKWNWMAAKNVAELKTLFHEESKFVHMSGTWKKARELDIIESGSIWYKNTIVHDTDVEIVGRNAVVWSRITLEAHVRGKDVANEFTATEVYVKSEYSWQLLALTFSSVRDTHKIEH